jgi:serine/threonine-protein kinase
MAPKMTHTGMVFGTPAFMAPEQASGRVSKIDATTDIWAVGATMFTLLSGALVHQGETAQHVVVLAATERARSLASVLPEAQPQLVSVVDRALTLENRRRWPSADAMREAIREASYMLFADPDPELQGAGELTRVRRPVFEYEFYPKKKWRAGTSSETEDFFPIHHGLTDKATEFAREMDDEDTQEHVASSARPALPSLPEPIESGDDEGPTRVRRSVAQIGPVGRRPPPQVSDQRALRAAARAPRIDVDSGSNRAWRWVGVLSLVVCVGIVVGLAATISRSQSEGPSSGTSAGAAPEIVPSAAASLSPLLREESAPEASASVGVGPTPSAALSGATPGRPSSSAASAAPSSSELLPNPPLKRR